MSNSKTVEMSEKHALEIAENFFEVIKMLFKVEPIYYCCKDKCLTIINIFDKEGARIRKQKIIHEANEDSTDISYWVLYNGSRYKIRVYDNEEIYGYGSCLPHIDRTRYVFCNVTEERDDKSKKCEMDFAFDIVDGTFLELFEIVHYNKYNVVRVCQCVNHIERILSGRQIMDVYTE